MINSIWDHRGVIPPFREGNATGSSRSPYKLDLQTVVSYFVCNAHRRLIMQGFLEYRRQLASIGITGFQWIDGSFTENVETTRNKLPADVDVVTFYSIPENMSQESIIELAPHLFDHDSVKQRFKVDGFYVDLSLESAQLIQQAVYWYSLWGHRRGDYLWKGFVEIDLSSSDFELNDDQVFSEQLGDNHA